LARWVALRRPGAVTIARLESDLADCNNEERGS